MSEQDRASLPPTGNLPDAAYRRFEGMREYEAIIDGLIPRTQRVIRVFDKTLSPAWNNAQRQEALRQFLLASRQNRLFIVVHEAESIGRICPRLMELVRLFGASLRIHETQSPAKQVYDPFVIFDASHYVHRFHYRFLRAAHGTNDVLGAQQLIDSYTEIWDASAPQTQSQPAPTPAPAATAAAPSSDPAKPEGEAPKAEPSAAGASAPAPEAKQEDMKKDEKK